MKHILKYLYATHYHHVAFVQVRHAGDMGNILAGEDGVARVDLGLKEELAALLNRCRGGCEGSSIFCLLSKCLVAGR